MIFYNLHKLMWLHVVLCYLDSAKGSPDPLGASWDTEVWKCDSALGHDGGMYYTFLNVQSDK